MELFSASCLRNARRGIVELRFFTCVLYLVACDIASSVFLRSAEFYFLFLKALPFQIRIQNLAIFSYKYFSENVYMVDFVGLNCKKLLAYLIKCSFTDVCKGTLLCKLLKSKTYRNVVVSFFKS